MGWGSGVDVAQDLWNRLKKELTEDQLKPVAQIIVDVFKKHDCDTLNELYEFWEVLSSEDEEQ